MVPVVLIVGATGLVIAGIVFLVWLSDKRSNGGLSAGQRRAILKRGLTARATVLDAVSLSTSMAGRILMHEAQVVVEVRGIAAEPYRAQYRGVVSSAEWISVRPNEDLPVRVDPADRTHVLFDWDAYWGRGNDKEKQAQHLARQAALMAGAPPATVEDPLAGTPLAGLPAEASELASGATDMLALLASGSPGVATVVSVDERGRNNLFCVLVVRLAVTPADGNVPFEASLTSMFKLAHRDRLVAGATVDVKYDPASRKVAVDLRAR